MASPLEDLLGAVIGGKQKREQRHIGQLQGGHERVAERRSREGDYYADLHDLLSNLTIKSSGGTGSGGGGGGLLDDITGQGTNLVGDALKALDYLRKPVQSATKQAYNVLPGGETFDAGELVDDASWSSDIGFGEVMAAMPDYVKDARDVVERAAPVLPAPLSGPVEGAIETQKGAERGYEKALRGEKTSFGEGAAGLAGDIASDPLNLLAGAGIVSKGAKATAAALQSKGVARATQRAFKLNYDDLLKRTGAASPAERDTLAGTAWAQSAKQAEAEVAPLVAKVLQKGSSALSASEMDKFLGTKGGLRTFDSLGSKQVLPKAVTDKITRPIAAAVRAPRNTKVGKWLDENLAGKNATLRSDLRSGDASLAIPALKKLRTVNREGAAREVLRSSSEHEMFQASRKLRKAEIRGEQQFQVLEDPTFIAKLTGDERDAAMALRSTFDNMLNRFRATGADIGEHEFYAPRSLTKEAKELVGEKAGTISGGKISAEKSRRLVDEALLPDGTQLHGSPWDIRNQVNEWSLNKHGFKFYESDPTKVFKNYVNTMTERIGELSTVRALADEGLIEGAVKTSKGAVKATSKKAMREAKRVKAKEAELKATEILWNTTVPEAFGEIHSADSLTAMKLAKEGDETLVAVSRSLDEEIGRLEEAVAKKGSTPAKDAELLWKQEQRSALGRLQQEQDATLRKVHAIEAEHAAAEARLASASTSLRRSELVAKKVKGDYDKYARLASQKVRDGMVETLNGVDWFVSDPALMEAIQGGMKAIDPDEMKWFLRQYDRAVSFIKGYQIATPGFHVRNWMGGGFNNVLAGSTDPFGVYYWKQKRLYDAGEFSKLKAGEKEILDQLTQHVHAGQYTRFELGGAQRSRPGIVNAIPEYLGKRPGGFVEERLRGSLGFDIMRNKGGSIDDALEAIAKYHFDYSDLSKLEQNVIKRVIPFYTWTRRNVPLQIENMVLQPRKYAWYEKAKDNIEGMSMPEQLVPEYLTDDMFGTRLPFGMGGDQAYGTSDLPFTQTLQDVTGIANLEGMVTPVIKTPFELRMGKTVFLDQNLEGEEPVPPTWAFLGKPFLEAGAAAGIVRKNDKGQYMAKKGTIHLIQDWMPLAGRLRRQAPSGDKRYEDRFWASWLSFLGVPIRTNTERDKQNVLRYGN